MARPSVDMRKATSRLARFRNAQKSVDQGFESALLELQTGGKRGHWIWYIFPQISGLGSSPESQTFAIDDAGEAMEFLRDAELRTRLLTISSVVAEELSSGNAKSLSALMGSRLDAEKVISSLTLFGRIARRLQKKERGVTYQPIVRVAEEFLALAAAEGYPPCAHTLRRIRRTE